MGRQGSTAWSVAEHAQWVAAMWLTREIGSWRIGVSFTRPLSRNAPLEGTQGPGVLSSGRCSGESAWIHVAFEIQWPRGISAKDLDWYRAGRRVAACVACAQRPHGAMMTARVD